MDLTGVWPEKSGGIYAIRQIGQEIWWVGVSETYAFRRGVIWTNVFHGTINGYTISGSWMDVPRGATTNGGTLELVVDDLGQQMTARDASGGFGGSQWSKTGDPVDHPLDINERFHETRRNDGGTMYDHLDAYKDCVVVTGWAANTPTGPAGLLLPSRRNYPDFIDACNRWADCGFLNTGDPPDGDVCFDIQVDRPALDAQPGIWTEGWLIPAQAFQNKLNNGAVGKHNDSENVIGPDGTTTNMLHCEAIMFGRTGDADHANDPNMQTLLPGWAQPGGDSVLINGQPAMVTPIGPPTDDNEPVDFRPAGITIRPGSSSGFGPDGQPAPLTRIRVSGVFALDCHDLIRGDCGAGNAAYHNAEIHPVYAIEVFQDFFSRDRSDDANLSGVWHCYGNDVGTYYVRQDGQEVWWFGISPDDGVRFANVFHGTLEGDRLTGTAVDVPLRAGATQNVAELSINTSVPPGRFAKYLHSYGPAWARYEWEKIYDTSPFPYR